MYSAIVSAFYLKYYFFSLKIIVISSRSKSAMFSGVLPRQSEGTKKFAKSEPTSGARAALMTGGTYGKNGPESKRVKEKGWGRQQ